MTPRALVLAFLLALAAPAVEAHEHAPVDWWMDAAGVGGVYPWWLQLAGVVRQDFPDGSYINYETALGQFGPSETEFFQYQCNYVDGQRWVITYKRDGTFAERHGVPHPLGKRLPCK